MIPSAAQTTRSATPSTTALAQRAISLVKSGRCAEALPILKKSAPAVSEKELKLNAGLALIRCAMTLDQRETVLGALSWMRPEFPHNAELLYVATHVYSDLATRTGQDLARLAPESYQAHEMNAESLEMQGKWDQALKQYEAVLQKNPTAPGIHFRIGRLLLSKPNPGPDMAAQAKKEFEAELKVDPDNAGAEYVLGELARQDQAWEDAIQHFSRAANLDRGFGDAYLGLGQSLISAKKFSEAISPLVTVVRLEPQNPTAHYLLATAYSRSGRKEEAEKEFAIHRQMTQKSPAGQDAPQ
jgi:tetratricopeptide (TPR) repeat protein